MRLLRALVSCVPVVFMVGASLPTARPHHVVLVTLDGLRIRELFTGMDDAVLKHATVEDLPALKARYQRPTPRERREALMPFLWTVLAPSGVILGGKSAVRVTNPHLISYPGYAELLTGQVQPAIRDNTPVRIPRETVLEFIHRKLALGKTQVAAYTSWDVLRVGVEHTPGSITVNAGYAPVEDAAATPAMRTLSQLQEDLRSPWNGVRPDAVTTALALEHLGLHKPRVLYVALGETDDWAHDGRYDRMLEAASGADHFLKTLWTTLQSMDGFKGHTTLIVTADHGRGAEGAGWKDHGPAPALRGSDETFLLMVGPDIPARGEVPTTRPVTTSQIAATMLGLLGLSAREFNPDAAPGINLTFAP